MSEKSKAFWRRFFKVFIGTGAVVAAATAIPQISSSWLEIGMWLISIVKGIIVGGVSGVLLGFEKITRWEND